MKNLSMKNPDASANYTLRELLLYFLKPGIAGFGGPVALVGYIFRNWAEERKWISGEDDKDVLTLARPATGSMKKIKHFSLFHSHFVFALAVAGPKQLPPTIDSS